jgi:(p)ppGpp synthase/HD superfamily hydrolase
MDPLPTRLYEAQLLAFNLHGRDARKCSTVPMLSHMLSVCAMVLQDGGTEDEGIAALLHDALEDKPEEISANEIEELFGKKVLVIIEISSDTPKGFAGGPKPPWRERKDAYLKHVINADPTLLRVTIADKVDNARAIPADHRRIGEKVWERFNAGKEDQLWYYQSALTAYRSAGFTSPLLNDLDELVSKLVCLS